jgi:hypothetical protein
MAELNHSCTHGKLANVKAIYNYCENCGILLITQDNKRLFFKKPKESEYKLDLDPIDKFKCVKESVDKTFQLTQPSTWYLSVRRTAMNYLKKLIKLNKFTEETFHLAMVYIDRILKDCSNSISDTKLDMITIGCFILAGKLKIF